MMKYKNDYTISQESIDKNIEDQKLWEDCKGDLTKRLDYPELNENSIVFDLGGYEGEWASNIYCRYNSNMYIFEPIKEFYDNICLKFKPNPKFHMFNFGLDAENKQEIMYVYKNSTSMLLDISNAQSAEIATLCNFNIYLNKFIGDIDLIKINIEGSEFPLLETLSVANLKRIKNIQIQFHPFVKDAEQRRKNIQRKLGFTHVPTYMHEFVWENWKLKPILPLQEDATPIVSQEP